MFTTDPAFAILAALATAAVLGLLIALYREHREPFLVWAIVAWAASLTSALAEMGALELVAPAWVFAASLAFAVKGFAFLAAGMAYREPAVVTPARAVACAVVAVLLAGLETGTVPFVPSYPPDLREFPLTLVNAAAIVAAGLAFWPRSSGGTRGPSLSPVRLTRLLAYPLLTLLHHARGARLLSISLLAWGVLQLGFLLLPATAQPGLLRTAGLLQGLQGLALVVLVLERARQRSEFMRRFNQRLLDGMEIGLALVGPDLRIQHTNSWMTGRFGHGVVGQTCLATYLATPTPCPGCPWRDEALESRQLTVDGPGGRKFLIAASPLTAPDGSRLLLELVNDVTEAEAMRARLLHSERLATVGEMASRVAHELRNPLAIMTIHADLVRGDLDRASYQEALGHVDIVKGEIRRVATLVESYLQFGRTPRLTLETVDLEALLDARLATIEAELKLHDIALRRERPEQELPAISADPEQLGRALMNLFRNAVEAMPDGGAVSVVTFRIDGAVTIEVTDTGPGVAPDEAERIFRPFHTTKPLGAGLGLALAREIIESHGGQLACRSQAGGGCFVVTLPLDGAPGPHS